MLLDKDALELIKGEKKNGKTYTQIAEELNEAGYIHHTGIPLTEKTVSAFCVRNGFKIQGPRTYRSKRQGQTFDKTAENLMREWRVSNISFSRIAKKLNRAGYVTHRNNKFNGSSALRYWDARVKNKTQPDVIIKPSVKIQPAKYTDTDSIFKTIIKSNLDDRTKLKIIEALHE